MVQSRDIIFDLPVAGPAGGRREHAINYPPPVTKPPLLAPRVPTGGDVANTQWQRRASRTTRNVQLAVAPRADLA